MVDTQTALEAHRNLTWIVARWPDLQARLHPGIPSALGGHDGGRSAETRLPIDTYVSDLMWEITQEAETLAHVLWDELDDPATFKPRTHMPDLLEDVASRYGHWTASDERTALAFCDWAEHMRERVTKCIERPVPPKYVGPCPHDSCDGELHVRDGRTTVRCPLCRRDIPMEEQREYLAGALEATLMERGEIVAALSILGTPVKPKTLDAWVQRGRLTPAQEDLFRLTDAMALAERAMRGRMSA